MRTGQELIKATKPFAQDNSARSWWYVLSTAGLLAAVRTPLTSDVAELRDEIRRVIIEELHAMMKG